MAGTILDPPLSILDQVYLNIAVLEDLWLTTELSTPTDM